MSKMNSRKIFGAILGVAGAAFVVDRVLLGGGGPASASAAEATAIEPAVKTSVGKDDASAEPLAGDLAGRLRTIAVERGLDVNSVKDGLRWEQAEAPEGEGAQAVKAPSAVEAAEAFREKVRLKSVMCMKTPGAKDMVVVEVQGEASSRRLVVGDEVQGMILRAVSLPAGTYGVAVFGSGNATVRLDVPMTGVQGKP